MSALYFKEGDWIVKSLEDSDDLKEAYRLRHSVFSKALKWVPSSQDKMEVDAYDSWASMIGVFNENGYLIALTRVIQAPDPFMLQAEFQACLLPGYIVNKESSTAEVSRFAVVPKLPKGLSRHALLVTLKGLYQWFLSREIKTCYMVIERRFFNALRAIGIPCEPISRLIALPPGGVESVATVLDLGRFRLEGRKRCPELLAWMEKV